MKIFCLMTLAAKGQLTFHVKHLFMAQIFARWLCAQWFHVTHHAQHWANFCNQHAAANPTAFLSAALGMAMPKHLPTLPLGFLYTLHIVALFFAMLGLSACQKNLSINYQTLTGETMGTSYHITFGIDQHSSTKVDRLQATIDQRLAAINASMSTYQDDSTVMHFNRAQAGQAVSIDSDFAQVLSDSRSIYQQSQGAFDPTVQPLVLLWGFGKKLTVERLNAPPSASEIAAAKDLIGLDKVQLTGNQLSKMQNGVALDFSAIAKGYGVDVIAGVLEEFGASAYLVEIGGEVATKGNNPQGKPWQIAIDAPVYDSTATNRTPLIALQLHDAHLATSGNYRNHLSWQGINYSHTIDPHTGYPVASGVPSVSVLHDSTALADGWATALTAMPQQNAIALAEQADIKALFIIKNGNAWQVLKSPAFIAYEHAHRTVKP